MNKSIDDGRLQIMIRMIAVSAVMLSLTRVGRAQSRYDQDATTVSGQQEAIHQRLKSYL